MAGQATLRALGFTDVAIELEPTSAETIASWDSGKDYTPYVASARITATKPGVGTRASAGTKTAGACCGPECCA